MIMAIILSFVFILITLEIIHSQFTIPAEITRKLAHILIGLLVIFWVQQRPFFEFLLIAILFLIVTIIFYFNKIPRSIYVYSRKTFGEVTYITGILLLGIFLYENKQLLNLGLLLLIFPDSIAGLYNYFSRKKNLDSIHAGIYFAVSFIFCIFYLPFPKVIMVSASLTIIEFVSSYGFDNITVPLVFTFLMKFF